MAWGLESWAWGARVRFENSPPQTIVSQGPRLSGSLSSLEN